MTLTELRYIVTLAQTQHFGQAAERCNVSQPTLSIAVKKLEQELGVDLFERSKNKISATPTGELVVAQAQRVLEESSRIQDIAAAGKDQLNSTLRLGAIFTIGPYLFPRSRAARQGPRYAPGGGGELHRHPTQALAQRRPGRHYHRSALY